MTERDIIKLFLVAEGVRWEEDLIAPIDRETADFLDRRWAKIAGGLALNSSLNDALQMMWYNEVSSVRRHINWNSHRPDLKEDLAHLVQDIKRRICGIASAGLPSFSV